MVTGFICIYMRLHTRHIYCHTAHVAPCVRQVCPNLYAPVHCHHTQYNVTISTLPDIWVRVCVCVHACVCVWVCVYVCVCVCVWIRIHSLMCTNGQQCSRRRSNPVSLSTPICISICVCACVCIRVCLCLCLCVVCVDIYTFADVHKWVADAVGGAASQKPAKKTNASSGGLFGDDDGLSRFLCVCERERETVSV